MDAHLEKIVERLQLEPHPEGGYFRQVYRSELHVEHEGIPRGLDRGRTGGTLIYFLLGAGDFSAFHRVRWTDEIWHLYAGGPIELHLIDSAGAYSSVLLTGDLSAGEPTAVVPGGWWQAARLGSGAKWALGGCTVSPGFEFADFQMPDRATLLERFPAHSAIIRTLTRGAAAT